MYEQSNGTIWLMTNRDNSWDIDSQFIRRGTYLLSGVNSVSFLLRFFRMHLQLAPFHTLRRTTTDQRSYRVRLRVPSDSTLLPVQHQYQKAHLVCQTREGRAYAARHLLRILSCDDNPRAYCSLMYQICPFIRGISSAKTYLSISRCSFLYHSSKSASVPALGSINAVLNPLALPVTFPLFTFAPSNFC
jgi:hypothetical protein